MSRLSWLSNRNKASLLVGILIFWQMPLSQAAPVEWTRQFGTAMHDDGRGISADGLGNLYVSGVTYGSLGGPHAGNADAYVSKYDATGGLQWTRQLSTTGYEGSNAVSADISGSVFIAGTQSAFGGSQAFLAKYDASGNSLWERQLAQDEVARGVSADGFGNVYVSGTTDGTASQGANVFLAKYDTIGNLQWRRVLSSGQNANGFADDYGSGVSADGLGNVYVSGHTNGNLGERHPGGPAYNAFVAKYDSAGNALWVHQVGTAAYEYSSGVAADRLGNVFLSGTTQGALGGTLSGFNDAFVAMFNSAGQRQWTQQWGSPGFDENNSVAADGLGNAYIAGHTYGVPDEPIIGGNYAYLAKFDAAGSLAWAQKLGVSEAGTQSFGVSADGLGSVYISGETTGMLGGPAGPRMEFADAFVAKYVDRVPEPSTLSLAAVAFTSLVRRKRRARKSRPAETARLAVESLESRQMLAATALTFHVVNDATANLSYEYSDAGTSLASTSLTSANSAPRGVASMVGVERTWVIDANRKVFVYDVAGTLLGSWTAGSLAINATPEGIATNGTDIWIVDSKSDTVFKYAGAASRLVGSQSATSSFSLNSGNKDAKDIVTDGVSLWVVNDSSIDKVFKYTVAGGFVGSWTISSANKTPTGIALDPANIGDIWIADSGTDSVYKYTAAASRIAGSQAAASSFVLASGNGNAQGIAGVPGALPEAPYEATSVLQYGSAGDDWVRGGTADQFGSIYLSGGTKGNLAEPIGPGPQATYLARYDTDLNLVWIEQQSTLAGVEFEGVRVEIDGAGNLYQVVQAVSGGAASALASFDANGNLRWSALLPVGESMFDVAIDSLGFAYTSSYEGRNVHLRKYDGVSGSIVWNEVHDTGGVTNSSGIDVDLAGNIYLTAYTYGAVLGSNAGGADSLVMKYDGTGVLQWSRQYGSADHDFAFAAEVDASGNLFSAGRTTGSLEGSSAGASDSFVAKHDAAGNLLWKTQWGTSGDEGSSSIWVDPQGNVFRAFVTNGAVAGPHLGSNDIVVAKHDPAGNLLWATQLGTSGDDAPTGGIWGDELGNLYVAGRTTGAWGSPNAGGQDAVLIKLSSPTILGGGSLAAAADSDFAESAVRLSADVAAGVSAERTTPAGKAVRAKERVFATFGEAQDNSLATQLLLMKVSKAATPSTTIVNGSGDERSLEDDGPQVDDALELALEQLI